MLFLHAAFPFLNPGRAFPLQAACLSLLLRLSSMLKGCDIPIVTVTGADSENGEIWTAASGAATMLIR